MPVPPCRALQKIEEYEERLGQLQLEEIERWRALCRAFGGWAQRALHAPQGSRLLCMPSPAVPASQQARCTGELPGLLKTERGGFMMSTNHVLAPFPPPQAPSATWTGPCGRPCATTRTRTCCLTTAVRRWGARASWWRRCCGRRAPRRPPPPTPRAWRPPARSSASWRPARTAAGSQMCVGVALGCLGLPGLILHVPPLPLPCRCFGCFMPRCRMAACLRDCVPR